MPKIFGRKEEEVTDWQLVLKRQELIAQLAAKPRDPEPVAVDIRRRPPNYAASSPRVEYRRRAGFKITRGKVLGALALATLPFYKPVYDGITGICDEGCSPSAKAAYTSIKIDKATPVVTTAEFPSAADPKVKVSKAASYVIKSMVHNKEKNRIGFQVSIDWDEKKFEQMIPKGTKDKQGKPLTPENYTADRFFSDLLYNGAKKQAVKDMCIADVQAITEAGKKLGQAIPDLAGKSEGQLAPAMMPALDNIYKFKPHGTAENNPEVTDAYLFYEDPEKAFSCTDPQKSK